MKKDRTLLERVKPGSHVVQRRNGAICIVARVERVTPKTIVTDRGRLDELGRTIGYRQSTWEHANIEEVVAFELRQEAERKEALLAREARAKVEASEEHKLAREIFGLVEHTLEIDGLMKLGGERLTQIRDILTGK